MKKEKEEVRPALRTRMRTPLTACVARSQGEEGSRGEGSQGGTLRPGYSSADDFD